MRPRATSYKHGIFAEDLVREFLIMEGGEILATRYKTPYGEIDIISKHGNTIIFSEVKKRTSIEKALLSLSCRQIKRIIHASQIFIQESDFADMDLRFDFFAVSQIGEIERVVNITS